MVVYRSSDSEQRLEQVSLLARAALERWSRFVHLLPSVAVLETHRDALRALVSWYERVCDDENFTDPPPGDASDVLSEIGLSHLRPASDPFAVVQGAVRIAAELVDYRKQLAELRRITEEDEAVDNVLEDQALRPLEAATLSVSQFLDSPVAASRQPLETSRPASS